MARNLSMRILWPAIPWLVVSAFAQDSGTPGRQQQITPLQGHLGLNQTRYEMRAGEATKLMATIDAVDFLRTARIRTWATSGSAGGGFRVLGPSVTTGEVLLSASLRTPPGEHSVSISAVAANGEERIAAVAVILNPPQAVSANATQPPVVLLNGWQWHCPTSTGSSSDTFGSLQSLLLQSGGVPAVYYFDNCVECPDCTIEDLGTALGEVLNLIRYDTGAPVPQIDLVGHSMGGLIARSYLAGLRADGSFSPPLNTRIRKLIEIATPNFGSFLAHNTGVQMAEMYPGSTFLWNLARWNQGADDLRGVDALAIIGNRGYKPFAGFPPTAGSDGVVSLPSASLGFARDLSRTRILPYCHVTSTFWFDILPFTPDCDGPGIADVDKAPETGRIILSFLRNTPDWTTIGATANQDAYLSQYGGFYLSTEGATGQWITDASQVSWGSVVLQQGGASGENFFVEFAKGTGTFQVTSNSLGTFSCGPFTAPTGYDSTIRCKFGPSIASVGPLLPSVPGWVVASGTTIRISGSGFGQNCSTCQVAAYPGGVPLQVSSWSDQAIAALLPAIYNGLANIVVRTTSGADAINIMTAPAQQPPQIAVSAQSVQFSYVVGAAVPTPRPIQISNAGGGTLSWTASSSAAWLKVSATSGAAPSSIAISIVPTGLTPGAYSATIQITAAGASNSPQMLPVVFSVSASPQTAGISLMPSALRFDYTIASPILSPQQVQITAAGNGSLVWTVSASAPWIVVSPASGTTPGTFVVSINPNGVNPGVYSGVITASAQGAPSQTIGITFWNGTRRKGGGKR